MAQALGAGGRYTCSRAFAWGGNGLMGEDELRRSIGRPESLTFTTLIRVVKELGHLL